MDFLKRFGSKANEQLETLIVPGAEAVVTVVRLHQERPDNHAFIVGPADGHPLSLGVGKSAKSSKSILEAAERISPSAWVAERQAAHRAHMEELRRTLSPEDFAEEEEVEADRHEPWPEDQTPVADYVAHLASDSSSPGLMKPAPQVLIALSPAPVSRWWETFAHTRFGGVNGAPEPDEHLAFAREWASSHGARLIANSFDRLEYSIAKPIASREEALRMADIHYEYCSDNITQNWGTFERYAATLLGAPVWSFWWD